MKELKRKKKLPSNGVKRGRRLHAVRKEDTKEKKELPSYPGLNAVTAYTADMLGNNDDIISLFPDTMLAMDIGVTSILSPNDGLNTSLLHSNSVSYLSQTALTNIITALDTHTRERYKLEDNLNTILYESLYTKGSYLNLIVPNTVSEELYKANTVAGNEESLLPAPKINTGMLGFSSTLSDIKDNERVSKNTVAGLEDSSDTELSEMFAVLQNIKDTPSINLDDINVGELTESPVRVKIPVESFIPVTLTNDNTKVIGGFVLIDGNGVPTQKVGLSNKSSVRQDVTLEGSILSTIREEIQRKTAKAPTAPVSKEDLDDLIDMQVKNLLNEDTSLSTTIAEEELDTIKHTMFSRLLKNQKTSVVYVSSKHLEMYTFNYRQNGTGESLLERIRVLSSIRAIIFFTRLKAEIKNNVPTIKITLDIDDDSIDPEATRDATIAEFIKNKEFDIPIGLQKINDLSDWIHKLGYFFEVNNKNIPKLGMNMEDVTRTVNIPEESIEKEITDKIFMSLGTTPETVNNSKEPDFATTEILKNIVVAKKAMLTQQKYNVMLSNNLRKLFRLDGFVREKIRTAIRPEVRHLKSVLCKVFDKDPSTVTEDAVISFVINDVINKHSVSLPEIKIEDDDKLSTEFDNYVDKIDTALEYYLNSEFIESEMASKLGDNIDTYKAATKATLIRRWCLKFNYLPELSDLVMTTDEGDGRMRVMDEHVEYIERLMDALETPLKKDVKVKKDIDKKFDRLDGGEEDTGGDDIGDGDTPNDDTGDGDTGDGDGVTDDDLGDI
jgi:hypothetical protein